MPGAERDKPQSGRTGTRKGETKVGVDGNGSHRQESDRVFRAIKEGEVKIKDE